MKKILDKMNGNGRKQARENALNFTTVDDELTTYNLTGPAPNNLILSSILGGGWLRRTS